MTQHPALLTNIDQVKVSLDFFPTKVEVGILIRHNRQIYFEYSADILEKGLEISPLKLPLKSGKTSFDSRLFEGLPGVFNDSLPDGWGRLLLDRKMKSLGILPEELSPLDRLSYVGSKGMGALVYEPARQSSIEHSEITIDMVAGEAADILQGETSSLLDCIIALNGSSAGARPKCNVWLNKSSNALLLHCDETVAGYEPWLVKFANVNDGHDAGAIEYVYSLMAKQAGLNILETRLLEPQRAKNPGYFAIKRFDRVQNKRLHLHSACGLLHTDFRVPCLDYQDLLKLTQILTQSPAHLQDDAQITEIYRLAVFNVLAHNRDDHAKNFSFLMDETGSWSVAPAYDLTFSSGPGGEQSTMVMGEGRKPSHEHLTKLGLTFNLPQQLISEILDQTKEALSKWDNLAREFGVSTVNREFIGSRIGRRIELGA